MAGGPSNSTLDGEAAAHTPELDRTHPPTADIPDDGPPLSPMVAARGAGPEPDRNPVAAGHRRPSLRRRLLSAGFVIVVVLTAGGLIVLALSQARPSWWQRVDAADPEVRRTAERLENGVATLLSHARPSGPQNEPPTGPANAAADRPWTVGLPAADANAWLNARLRTWMENQQVEFAWPEALTELQVDFRDNRIYVGARIREVAGGGGGEQVLSAVLAPRFHSDGSLWMPAESVALGRISLPASWFLGGGATPHPSVVRDVVVGDAERELGRLPQTREVLAAFAGTTPVLRSPMLSLGDGRRVRLLGLSAVDGKLYITCQTQTRDAARAER